MTTTPPCPLCGASAPSKTRTLDRAAVAAEWQRWLDLDLADELSGIASFPEWRCSSCGLVFYPPETAGSGALYEALQRFPWYYLDNKWEYDEALKEIAPTDRVCEAGCGQGAFLEKLGSTRPGEAFGLELNADAVARARAKGLSVDQMSLESLAEARPGAFDVVCSFQVLEHVPDPGAHLRAAHALLAPGGRLLVGLPNQDSFLGDEDNILDRPPHHISRWTPAVLQRALPALGFRVRRVALEPLIPMHVRSFLVARLRARVAPRLPAPLGRLIQRHRVLALLDGLLVHTGIHRRFMGQTFFLAAEKSP